MKIQKGFATLAVASLLVGASVGVAQEKSDESAVWAVIEEQWERQERGDNRWIEDLLTADFTGWQNDAPAPRNRRSERTWAEFAQKHGKVLEHELYPLSIVVHENMAIAHYLYTEATEDQQGEVNVTNGRYTDVLVREPDGWRFISWHGGADPDDD